MKMRKAYVAFGVLGLLGGLLVVKSSVAGQRIVQPVNINLSIRQAYGSLGSARASADTLQSIGCATRQTGATTCSAVDAAGNFASCSTTDAGFRSAVNSINGDSRIIFTWDAGNVCTSIQVENYSSWAPKGA